MKILKLTLNKDLKKLLNENLQQANEMKDDLFHENFNIIMTDLTTKLKEFDVGLLNNFINELFKLIGWDYINNRKVDDCFS